jgi:hypothetical protein
MLRISGIVIVVCMLVFCDGTTKSEDCSTLSDPKAGIELIYPKGGENLTFGNTVSVKWKVDPLIVPSIVVQVSTVGSNGPFRNLFNKSITVQSDEVSCMDTLWTIGSEVEASSLNWPSTGATVYLRVAKYNAESAYASVSSLITINRP